MSISTHALVKYLGKRFRESREECGFSREEAADRIGITVRTLAAYERGEREPKAETAIKIAKAYRTNLTKLTNCAAAVTESGAIEEEIG